MVASLFRIEQGGQAAATDSGPLASSNRLQNRRGGCATGGVKKQKPGPLVLAWSAGWIEPPALGAAAMTCQRCLPAQNRCPSRVRHVKNHGKAGGGGEMGCHRASFWVAEGAGGT